MYFVWMNNHGIAYPQKWWHEQINSATGKLKNENVIKKFKLSATEEDLLISELMQIYPNEE